MKILTVVGARPQFIKAALVSEEIRKDGRIEEVLVHTGQHYDYNMSQQFFEELNLRDPHYNLEIGSMPRIQQIEGIREKLGPVLVKEQPSLVVVYGDTNSTLAAALCAASRHMPVCHIEAGLRSFDNTMPEEINRTMTDHVSAILMCPTRVAVKNLRKEDITKGVYLVGDIMFELALKSAKTAEDKSRILKKLKLEPKEYILATVHRQANTDIKRNLDSIVSAFLKLKSSVVFPVHPRTKKMLKKFSLWNKLLKAKNMLVIEPVGYLDMIALEKNAKKILTDSGGVQKEAYFFKVPCITLRERTEWVETVNGGWNKLVGVDVDKIIRAVYDSRFPGAHKNYYGTGNTSRKIIDILKKTRLG